MAKKRSYETVKAIAWHCIPCDPIWIFPQMTAPLIIVSGPSGCGKSTLVGELLRITSKPLRVSISATTRPARAGETDGKHYHFWTRERFESEIAADRFLEHAFVHGDHHYGTPRGEVEPYLHKGSVSFW